MFVNKKNEKLQEQRGSSFNLIANGTEITGDINTSGDLRIDGQIIGDITCTAKLIIGENGEVNGNINCHSGEISGTVQGQIVAKEILQLNQSATIQGDIKAMRFVVEDGASINGRCTTSKSLSLPDHLPEVKLIGYEKKQAVTR
ncbi:bactofilin family protein [Parapedobacter koreensis]|uniref:Polymer-forming protein n=1 Tax=Parapedobacter koreensis TaxID=332977 RepID=A0A1H7F525_9SPHI|nr:polymer-forming cytoskeletal protein [Parapedobacter koreensis]SEK18245.1 Polymer-forming protein [Parapedobacter koreensis]